MDRANLFEVVSFVQGKPDLSTQAAQGAWETYAGSVGNTGFKIETLEGIMTANVNDWIIKGVAGEFYPCKPDIFEQTYELDK